MQKAAKTELPFDIQPETVARYGLGGLLTGGAVASALNLVKLLRDMSQQRQEDPATETDEGTIVLTLPQKSAAQRSRAKGSTPWKDSYTNDGNIGDYNASEPPSSTGRVNPERGIENKSSDPTAVQKTTGPEERTTGTNRRQLRHPEGEFGIKTANWPTLTASLLSVGAGGLLGYRLVDKLFEVKRIKSKERELEEAKREYLDMLADQGEKTSFDELFDIPMDKQALFGDKRKTFSLIDMPLGIAALAFLLGSGGSAYITKRILDKMEEEKRKPDRPKPAVKRIVFRAGGPEGEPGMDELKEAQVADEVFDAALGVYLDVQSGDPQVLGNEKVAAEMEKVGVDAEQMLPGPDSDLGTLLATLQANPELRQVMQGAMLESHPLARHFKWAFKLPGISGMADQALYQKVLQAFRPGPKTAEAARFEGMCKEAGIFSPQLADIAASFYGSTLAGRMSEEEKAELKEELTEEDPEERVRKLLSDLQISAEDPQAAAFVLENREKILQLLRQMAADEKI